ncbi:MAG TPA: hypothetical protein VH853_08350 [Polyangia bacterium]|jgi:hypothetical protein|nr:hypothetical protein [Polyangia bacterium]
MTAAAQERALGGRVGAMALTFSALAALTAAELKVAALDVAGRARATALAGLLLFKVGLVLLACLRADFRRRSTTRLTLLALVLAAGFAAVLMLEAAFQARLR